MNIKYFVIAAVAVLVLIILGFVAINQKKTQATLNNINPTPTVQSLKTTTNNITYTNDGFVPNEIIVNVGSRVVWSNLSDGDATVNSDTYPTNLLWKFLNLGLFKKDEHLSTVFRDEGEFTYHNQLSPNQKGTVIVK